LWFIDAAGLGRPHVLGHSIGGWTAAEMAAMSPGAINRLILVAPVGLKPETGEILDIFFYSPAQLLAKTIHDPKTVPEWDALYGTPPTPAQLEIAERNREMTARLTWKPYMHNPRLAHFLPRVTNPALTAGGREDQIEPADCGEQYRHRRPNAGHTRREQRSHLPPREQPHAFHRLVRAVH